MRAESLARRIFLMAVAWGVLSLLVAGFLLVTAYRASVEQAFDERLGVHQKSLVAAFAAQGDVSATLRPPEDIAEPLFALPLSGWYWMVRAVGDDRVVLASPSLTGEVLDLPTNLAGAGGRLAHAYVDGPDGQKLRLIERVVDFDGARSWRIAVAGNAGDLAADISGFTWRTVVILAIVGLGSIVSALVLVRLALAPIERLRRSLHRIQAGEEDRLPTDVPVEMAPFAHELNGLIASNHEAMERARTHAGNLAHALKTPLSVLLNEAREVDSPLARHVVEQASLMREHVQHHLDRARIAAQRRVLGVVTDVAPVVERLARAMRKIHEDRGISIELDMEPGLRFRGEREDLEEALGNLVDNACKWCRSRVVVRLRSDGASDVGDRRRMIVLVDDDGPGLSPEIRAQGPRRGRRLDETTPGSGLGLAIVAETAALYGGSFELAEADLGGLRCELVLPAL